MKKHKHKQHAQLARNRYVLAAIIFGIVIVCIVGGAFAYVTTQNTVKTCTSYNRHVENQCIEDYIGMSEQAAQEKAIEHGLDPTVIKLDQKKNGDVQYGVDGYSGYRIFLETRNGIVVNGYYEDGLRPE